MSITLTDARIWVGAYDLSGTSNNVDLTMEADENDSTTFDSDGWKENLAGLKASQATVGGFLDPVLSEAAIQASLGNPLTVVSVGVDSTSGADAYFGRRMGTSMTRGAQVGSMALLNASLTSSTPEGMVRGVVAAPAATRTTTGTGTAIELGAAAAGQKVHASLHVFSGTGTLDLVIQSDDASGFASPSPRITFDQMTGAGSQFKSVSGSITDDWWRASWTVASDPEFRFAVCFGVV